jgi:hypothetical protein
MPLVTDQQMISSQTLTEVTLRITAIDKANKIRTQGQAEACLYIEAPAVHTLRWVFDFRKVRYLYFQDIEGQVHLRRNRFPMLKRVELQFLGAAKKVWNCSALKDVFSEYENLDFVFSIVSYDMPRES